MITFDVIQRGVEQRELFFLCNLAYKVSSTSEPAVAFPTGLAERFLAKHHGDIWRQHDAHEYLCWLLDILQEQLGALRMDPSIVSAVLHGNYLQTTSCKGCHVEKNEKIDTFVTFTIPMTPETVSVASGITAQTAPAPLSLDNQRWCSVCEVAAEVSNKLTAQLIV